MFVEHLLLAASERFCDGFVLKTQHFWFVYIVFQKVLLLNLISFNTERAHISVENIICLNFMKLIYLKI